jgi:ketosteroid isomerase-like protein
MLNQNDAAASTQNVKVSDALCAKVVRQYYDLVDLGDLSLLDLFHPDAHYKRPGYGIFEGRSQLRAFYETERLIERGRHNPRQILTAAGRVAVEGTFRGVLKTGTQVVVPFSDFFDIEAIDGAPVIRSRRTYFDDVTV